MIFLERLSSDERKFIIDNLTDLNTWSIYMVKPRKIFPDKWILMATITVSKGRVVDCSYTEHADAIFIYHLDSAMKPSMNPIMPKPLSKYPNATQYAEALHLADQEIIDLVKKYYTPQDKPNDEFLLGGAL